MSQINIRDLCNENEDGAPTIVGVSTFSATSYMCPPKGTTAQRPENPVSGSLRFNTDTASLEYYKGDTLNWTQIEMTSTEPLGGGTGSNAGTGHRGLYGSGQVAPSTGTYTNSIEYLTISTLGNAQDFGDLAQNRSGRGFLSSTTRAVIGSGYGPADDIEYVTIASTGNALAFGLELGDSDGRTSLADSVRGVFAGKIYPNVENTISYITIATTGNAVDYGDLVHSRSNGAAFASSTRGIIAGGSVGETEYNNIDYITIRTTGNSIDFGDLNYTSTNTAGGGSNSTRGIAFGGTDAPGYSTVNNISYLTIATLGNAIDFGDATSKCKGGAGCPDPTRLVMKLGGGDGSGQTTNIINYVQISTTGNAIDFGDSVLQNYSANRGSCSTGHGGL